MACGEFLTKKLNRYFSRIKRSHFCGPNLRKPPYEGVQNGGTQDDRNGKLSLSHPNLVTVSRGFNAMQSHLVPCDEQLLYPSEIRKSYLDPGRDIKCHRMVIKTPSAADASLRSRMVTGN